MKERFPRDDWIGDWMSHRAGLYIVAKRKYHKNRSVDMKIKMYTQKATLAELITL
jgi:hypothetical protein